jgi:hypothetical protein
VAQSRTAVFWPLGQETALSSNALQGPKVELLHQVGNALVHCHQVQDPHVTGQVACRGHDVAIGSRRTLTRLGEIHAPVPSKLLRRLPCP